MPPPIKRINQAVKISHATKTKNNSISLNHQDTNINGKYNKSRWNNQWKNKTDLANDSTWKVRSTTVITTSTLWIKPCTTKFYIDPTYKISNSGKSTRKGTSLLQQPISSSKGTWEKPTFKYSGVCRTVIWSRKNKSSSCTNLKCRNSEGTGPDILTI